MKKVKLFILVLSIVISTFTGCSKSDNETKVNKAEKKQGSEVVLKDVKDGYTETIEDIDEFTITEDIFPELYIRISINPDIGLYVDNENSYPVCGISYNNQDAKELLEGCHLVDRGAAEVYAVILERLNEKGYASIKNGKKVIDANIEYYKIDKENDNMIFKLIEKGKNDDIEIAKNITTALEKVDVMAKEELQKDNFNLVDSVNYDDSIKYIMESRAREEENKHTEEPPKEEEHIHEEYEEIAEVHGPRVCDRCNGTGIVVCERCNGTGKVTCEQCNGTMEVPCTNCSKKGVGLCDGCDGTGVCKNCGGKGCALCDYQSGVTCKGCAGSGICNHCHGTGKTKTCNRCWGYYGYPPCTGCDGNGTAGCNRCNGTGIVE
ncbi:MAG: hypothetical protein K6G26_00355 [Lachnospiraceae bacterium]|nr:hypothetical protein [Lachnospiraceae bacterium]